MVAELKAEADHEPAHVVAVVLNYNGRDETLACLESLRASDWPRMTTIVVDNGSDDDIAAAVAARFEVTLVRNGANLGFAGGMNAGLRMALDRGADYALLLNNDTLVDPAMVRTLVQAARSHPDAGIVSPLILYRDAPDVVSSAGLRFDPRRGYHGQPIGMGETNDGQFQGVRAVDASPGTAMLVPTAAVREAGMLDEALYLYLEDVDWSLRMRALGRGIYMALDAHLWHGVSQTGGGEYSPLIAYYGTRNTFVVCGRHAPLRGLRRVLRHGEILVTNVVHARRGARPLANAAAALAGWRDYLRGRLGPRRSG
jgi:GT2 family glycosyltransferase